MNSGTGNTLEAVWGSSGSDIYAVGINGTILHYPSPPHLAIRKEAAPANSVPYRGAFTYTVVLDNSGAADARSTVLTDTLPGEAGLARWVARPSGAIVSGDDIAWKGTVTGGQAITLSFVVNHVGRYGDVVTNTAWYSHASGGGNDSATFTVQESAIFFLPLVMRTLAP